MREERAQGVKAGIAGEASLPGVILVVDNALVEVWVGDLRKAREGR